MSTSVFSIILNALLIMAGMVMLAIWLRRTAKEKDHYNNRFYTLFNMAKDSMLVINSKGDILDVNSEAIRVYGYGRDEFLNLNIRQLRTSSALMSFEKQFEQAKTMGGINFETVHRRKNGSAFNVEVSSRARFIDGDYIYVSIIRDITKRNHMEDILAATSDLVAIGDPEGNLMYLNNAGRKLLGLDENTSLEHFNILGSFPDWALDLYEKTTKPSVFDKGVWQGETAILDKYGREVPMSQVMLSHRKADTTVDYVSTIMRDISNLREAEEMIRQSQECIKAQYNNLPYPLLTYRYRDGDFVLEDYSRVTEAYTQGKIRRYLNKSFTEILSRRPDIIELMLQCYENKEARELETGYVMLSTGETRHIVFNFAYVPPDMLLIHVDDITARIKAEAKTLEQMKRANTLSGISDALAKANTDYAGTLPAISELISNYFGDFCVIYLADNSNRMSPVSFYDADAEKLALFKDLVSAGFSDTAERMLDEIIRKCEPYMANNISQDSARSLVKCDYTGILDRYYIRGIFVIPLKNMERSIGAIAIIRTGPAHPYTEEDQVILCEIADRIAQAISNILFFKEVQARREQMVVLSRRLVEVQENEKRFLARELHDEMGQTLTALKMGLGSIIALKDEKSCRMQIEILKNYVDELLNKTRQLSLDLRPPMLDDLGLMLTLIWHFQRYTAQTGVKVAFKHSGLDEARFSSDIETTVYRVVQEALNNVAKHAQTDGVVVKIWLRGGVLGVEVSDEGKGFDCDKPEAFYNSSGLSGMRERVLALGGSFEIRSKVGVGTQLITLLQIVDVK